jgi:hypothetical protein
LWLAQGIFGKKDVADVRDLEFDRCTEAIKDFLPASIDIP